MNLQTIDLRRLRGGWRSVRQTSIKLMHHSLSTVGLFAVALVALLTTHPEYAHTVGQWMSIRHMTSVQGAHADAAGLDPLAEHTFSGSRIANRTEEASRLLGLMNGDLSPPDADAVSMRKVSDEGRSQAGNEAGAGVGSTGPALTKEEREVSRYISRKYRVNNDAIALVVDAAYATGKDLRMDPILLLAVMAIESGFNPFAQSTAGASGLMQLMAKVHRDKLADFGGANIALNPVANVRVGAVVLKDCIRRGGSIADGLRLYVGAGTGDDNGYGARVLQERDRILQAARGIARPRIEPIPVASRKLNAPTHATDGNDKADDNKIDAAASADRPEQARLASL